MSTEITVGSNAMVKVGAREINATILAIAPNGYVVRSNSSGKEFQVNKIFAIENGAEQIETVPDDSAESVQESETAVETEPEETEESTGEETPNPAVESPATEKPEKKLSLMDAAVEVLKQSEVPLNTREIVAQAIAKGLWTPTSCKTPEQTLYGSIFREIATKENPRIVKSEQKGKFKLAE